MSYNPSHLDPIIPKKEKIQEWGESIISYAVDNWISRRYGRAEYFMKLKNSYNGIVSQAERQAIDQIFGIANRTKWVDFRLSRNKVDTILGEFLMKEIKASPVVLNRDTKAKKTEIKNRLQAMYILKDTIKKLQESGVDVTGGVKVPETEEEAIARSSYKSKAEIFFERVTAQWAKKPELKMAFYSTLQDKLFTSEAHARVYINEMGKVQVDHISPEDAIFEEMKNDPLCKKSTYKGSRMWMTKAQVYKTFNLDQGEKNIIDGWFVNKGDGGLPASMFLPSTETGESAIAVFHLEWHGLEAWPLKQAKIKDTEKSFFISHQYYQENKNRIHNEAKKGAYKLDVRYKQRLFEGYQIGFNIYKNIDQVKNTRESENNPFYAPFTYQNILFNTVNGIRVPFYALMEEAKMQYNWVRNMINRELSKFKGVVFGYNRALLPVNADGKPVSMNYILWRILNDGVIDYSTAAEHNFSGKDFDVSDIFKATDLGVTSALETLIRLGYDLERLVDRLSSVNDNRQGLTSASETATNANNNIVSSRTITEPMMYFFDIFCGEVFKSVLDCYRVKVMINKEEVAEEIGDDASNFFYDMEVAVCEIGVVMENNRMIDQVRQRIQKYIEVSLNAGELAIPDAFEVETAQTIAEAKAILRNSWENIQKLKAEESIRNNEAQAAMKKQELDTQIAFREDQQQHEIEKIGAKAKTKSIENAQQSAAKQQLQKTAK